MLDDGGRLSMNFRASCSHCAAGNGCDSKVGFELSVRGSWCVKLILKTLTQTNAPHLRPTVRRYRQPLWTGLTSDTPCAQYTRVRIPTARLTTSNVAVCVCVCDPELCVCFARRSRALLFRAKRLRFSNVWSDLRWTYNVYPIRKLIELTTCNRNFNNLCIETTNRTAVLCKYL